jgi:hypothetical protein
MSVTAGRSDVVDLYNGASGIWSTAQLSEGRNSPAATTISVGNLAIFAGGSGNCSFAMCDGGFVLGLLCVLRRFACCLLLFVPQEVTV